MHSMIDRGCPVLGETADTLVALTMPSFLRPPPLIPEMPLLTIYGVMDRLPTIACSVGVIERRL
jgi:hypothetical protein